MNRPMFLLTSQIAALLTVLFSVGAPALAAQVDVNVTPVYRAGLMIQGGNVDIFGMGISGNGIKFAGGGIAKGNSPTIDLNQGGSWIKDDGDLKISTDDNLRLLATDVWSQGVLHIQGAGLSGNVYDFAGGSGTTPTLNFNKGDSKIYDDGNLRLATDDTLYLQAPTLTVVTGGLQTNGKLTIMDSIVNSAGQVLLGTTPGAGGGGSTSASDLTSGTLADARLSANIPLLDAANAFTAAATFGSNVTLGTTGGASTIKFMGPITVRDDANTSTKFSVDNDTGNTTIAGTLGVTGTATANALSITTTSTFNGTVFALAGFTEAGAVSLNDTGSAVTTIGATSNSGTITIGNALAAVVVKGALSINASNNTNTNINTGTSNGTVAIGNSASTTNILGTVNINASGSASTSIGGGAGGSGNVSIGNGTGGINLQGTTSIAGRLRRTVTNSITASATHTVAGATALAADINIVTAGSANDAIKLPNADAGLEITVINRTGATIDIWPDTTGNGINALGANAGYDVADITEVKCISIALTPSNATNWECEKLSR